MGSRVGRPYRIVYDRCPELEGLRQAIAEEVLREVVGSILPPAAPLSLPDTLRAMAQALDGLPAPDPDPGGEGGPTRSRDLRR